MWGVLNYKLKTDGVFYSIRFKFVKFLFAVVCFCFPVLSITEYFLHFVIDVKKDKKSFALRSALLSLEDNGAGRLSMTALTWL